MVIGESDFEGVMEALTASGAVLLEPGVTPTIKTRWANQGTRESPDWVNTGEVVRVGDQTVMTVKVRERTVNGSGDVGYRDLKVEVLVDDPARFAVGTGADELDIFHG